MVNRVTADRVRGSASMNGSQTTAIPPVNAASAVSHCRRGRASSNTTNAAAHGFEPAAAARASPAQTGSRRATACSAATEKPSASRSSMCAKCVVSSAHTGRNSRPANSSRVRCRRSQAGTSRHTAASTSGPVSDMAAIAVVSPLPGPIALSRPDSARASGPICRSGWAAYSCSPAPAELANRSRPPWAKKCQDCPAMPAWNATQASAHGHSSSHGHAVRTQAALAAVPL